MASILKRESRLRSPLTSLLAEGERWMVGFDEVFNNLVEKWEDGFDGFHEYPSSNIKKIDDHHYRIELALAGFKKEELSITLEGETLVITGKQHEEKKEEEEDYVQRGIKTRNFQQKFQLTEHDEIMSASLDNGILAIDVKRSSNFQKKKIEIPIKSG
jgi:molecular chaperone IbpA